MIGNLIDKTADRLYFGKSGEWKKADKQTVDSLINQMAGKIELRKIHVGGTMHGCVESHFSEYDVSPNEAIEKVAEYLSDKSYVKIMTRGSKKSLSISNPGKPSLLHPSGPGRGDCLVVREYNGKNFSKLYNQARKMSATTWFSASQAK